jgi:hypothetical protein
MKALEDGQGIHQPDRVNEIDGVLGCVAEEEQRHAHDHHFDGSFPLAQLPRLPLLDRTPTRIRRRMRNSVHPPQCETRPSVEHCCYHDWDGEVLKKCREINKQQIDELCTYSTISQS